MSKKLIVSADALHRFLSDCDLDKFDREETVTISVSENKISIPEITENVALCECKDEIREEMWLFKVIKLRDLLSKVDDQPIVIHFNRGFEIHYICI